MAQLIKAVIDTQKNSYRSIGQVNAADDLELELEVKMNGQPIEFINPECELLIKKSDNNKVRQTKDIIYKDGKFKIKVDEQGVTYPGIVTCQLLTKEDGRVSTCLFYFMVGTSLDREVLQSISKVETLEQLDEYVVTAFSNLDEYETRLTELDGTMKTTNEEITVNESERKANESERKTNETLRIENEKERVKKENERSENELDRKENELDRIKNENARRIAENTRITRENARENAEVNRNAIFEENEAIRNEAEKLREKAEAKRKENFSNLESLNEKLNEAEAERVRAEGNRESKETERQLAESEREKAEANRENTYTSFNDAEVDRKNNENARIQAENLRVQAESIRAERFETAQSTRETKFQESENNRDELFKASETARATEEIAREKAESTREGNEAIRVNSESLRESSENARQQEEIKRSQAEVLRVEAEKERELSYEEIKKDNSTFKDNINSQYEDIVTEFDKVIANVTNGNENATNSEIVQARGKKVNLNARLDNFDEQLEHNARELEAKKANQSDLIIERKRIDNLTKLNEGSTTGDAELIDARIGINGADYDNVGSAIREQIKNSISSNSTTISYSIDDSFVGRLYKVPLSLYKGQTIQVFISDTDGVLNETSSIAFGIDDLNNNRINGVCSVKPNEIGEFTLSTDIIDIVLWIGSDCKVLNGTISLIIKHKQNIYEELTELNNNMNTLNANNTAIMNNLFGNDKTMFNNVITSNIVSGNAKAITNEVNIKANDTIYVKVISETIDANAIINIGITYLSETVNNIIELKVNKEYKYTLRDENATSIKLWIESKYITSNESIQFIVRNYSETPIIETLSNEITLLKNSRNKGLSFSIIGDSYSTYKEWIPDNYSAWYSDSGNSQDNDVNSVKQTWWHLLSKETKISLLTNSSYSGSTICNTGYNGEDYSNKSFIARIKKDIGENQTTSKKPDIIFIFGGTNDYWANSPIGELKYSNWTTEDLKNVLPSFCYMIDYLQLYNPNARIINIINNGINNTDISNGMIEACEYYNIEYVILPEISKTNGHPNQEGMIEIKNQIMNIL